MGGGVSEGPERYTHAQRGSDEIVAVVWHFSVFGSNMQQREVATRARGICWAYCHVSTVPCACRDAAAPARSPTATA